MRRRDSRQIKAERPRARVPLLALAALLVLPPTRALAASPEISASLSTGELTLGAPLSVSGQARDGGAALAAVPLALQADPYPYRGFATIAHALSAPDGGFAFVGVQPTLNTRLRVLVESLPTAVGPTLRVIVDPAVAINATGLGTGRTRLSVRIRHAPQLASGPVSAWWFTAARGTRVFGLAAVTPTREPSPGITYASATVDPPARRFVYRVCLNPSWERAMGAPAAHGACPQRDFTVAHDVG
jgi:hypothetical protein